MKTMIKKNMLWVILAVMLFAQTAAALEVPVLKGRVNDNAGVLTPDEVSALETMLIDVESKTSSQVALLIIPSLEGEVLEDFSLQVAEKWKLGQKGFDNGVLVLVALAERQIRIEVGYGLESILTDAKTSYITRKMITPEFKQRRYFAGLNNGLKAVGGIIANEYDISPEQLKKFQDEQRKAKGPHLPWGLIIIGIFILSSFIKGAGKSGMGSAASTIFWGSTMGGGSHRSSGGFFGGGGGGFGGGGFSGGGGSFGGGGSSGSW